VAVWTSFSLRMETRYRPVGCVYVKCRGGFRLIKAGVQQRIIRVRGEYAIERGGNVGVERFVTQMIFG